MYNLTRKISERIDKKLSEISERSSNQFIFRINNLLRMTNEAAYEPKMVSIGPYHRGKNNLQKMENYKLEYLQGILKRQNESDAWRYIESLIEDEEVARSYYAEDMSLSREEFVEMMLLDGCFIVEFLRKYKKKDDNRDPIFKIAWILDILRIDLLLFENQIPFFILVKLFDMTKIPDDNEEENLISMAVFCLNEHSGINFESSPFSSSSSGNVFHLLSLMYQSWCSSFARAINKETENIAAGPNSDGKKRPEFSCITLGKPCFGLKQQEEEESNDKLFIKSVSELTQYGIKFVKSKQCTSWLDIKFENGKIRIPPLIIDDGTETILRNLIVYEQYMFDLKHSGTFVTDYVTFMDYLIYKPMDIQELRVKGIIKNWLGDDKEVSDMFNKLGNTLSASLSGFTYREIFKQVNEHCNKERNSWINDCNSWISDLKYTYFKNPWSIISVLAASILLILTFIQTIFSIL